MHTRSRSKKVIIGIHGLRNKPDQETLETWWKTSMMEGLNRINSSVQDFSFELVFWADILYAKPLDPTLTDPTNPQYLAEPYTIGNGQPEEFSPSLRAKIYSYIDKQLDSIFLRDDLSLNLKGVTDRLISKYFSDLEKYIGDDFHSLVNPDQISREDIKRRLFNVLEKYEGYDIFLISHSMGSIIAYDVLIECSKNLNIQTFMTIGSPLGIPYIMVRELEKQRSIDPELKRPLVPNCITDKWVNLSDAEDRVALDHALQDDFTTNRHGVTITDMQIYNDYEVRGERNPHKSFGYLRTPELARLIADFLRAPDELTWFQRWQNIVRPMLQRSRNFIHKIRSR